MYKNSTNLMQKATPYPNGLVLKVLLVVDKVLGFSFLGPSCCSYRCHTWRKRAHHMRKVVTKTGQCVRRQYPRGSLSSRSPPLSCSSCSSLGPSSPLTGFRSPPHSIRQNLRHTASLDFGVSSQSWLPLPVPSAHSGSSCPGPLKQWRQEVTLL